MRVELKRREGEMGRRMKREREEGDAYNIYLEQQYQLPVQWTAVPVQKM